MNGGSKVVEIQAPIHISSCHSENLQCAGCHCALYVAGGFLVQMPRMANMSGRGFRELLFALYGCRTCSISGPLRGVVRPW